MSVSPSSPGVPPGKLMRLAVVSDVHGNPIALDAVLAELAAQGGADGYLVLGDLVAIGHDPVGVLERLVALPGVRFVQGNTDRYVVTGQRRTPVSRMRLPGPSSFPAWWRWRTASPGPRVS